MTAVVEFLDHTADLGLRVTAPDLPGLFVGAAEALFEQITDRDAVRPVQVLFLDLEGDDLADLLQRWLSELLYLFETEGLLFHAFRVTGALGEAAPGLCATVWGETYDEARHPQDSVVKAVTRHDLAVARCEDGWTATVIFDV